MNPLGLPVACSTWVINNKTHGGHETPQLAGLQVSVLILPLQQQLTETGWAKGCKGGDMSPSKSQEEAAYTGGRTPCSHLPVPQYWQKADSSVAVSRANTISQLIFHCKSSLIL